MPVNGVSYAPAPGSAVPPAPPEPPPQEAAAPPADAPPPPADSGRGQEVDVEA